MQLRVKEYLQDAMLRTLPIPNRVSGASIPTSDVALCIGCSQVQTVGRPRDTTNFCGCIAFLGDRSRDEKRYEHGYKEYILRSQHNTPLSAFLVHCEVEVW